MADSNRHIATRITYSNYGKTKTITTRGVDASTGQNIYQVQTITDDKADVIREGGTVSVGAHSMFGLMGGFICLLFAINLVMVICFDKQGFTFTSFIEFLQNAPSLDLSPFIKSLNGIISTIKIDTIGSFWQTLGGDVLIFFISIAKYWAMFWNGIVQIVKILAYFVINLFV